MKSKTGSFCNSCTADEYEDEGGNKTTQHHLIECIYCESKNRCPGDGVDPADSTDDESWNHLRRSHHPGCEWVDTRAFRL